MSLGGFGVSIGGVRILRVVTLFIYPEWWKLTYFFICNPGLGEMIQFDEHIFQLG